MDNIDVMRERRLVALQVESYKLIIHNILLYYMI